MHSILVRHNFSCDSERGHTVIFVSVEKLYTWRVLLSL